MTRTTAYIAAYIIISSVCTALLTQAVTYGIVWRFVRDNPQSRPRQFSTRGTLRELKSVVLAYRKKHKSFPKSLTIQEIAQKSWLTYDGFDPERGPYDAWGRPFHYELDADSFLISSLGRDGKVGGTGVDMDLYSESARFRTEDWEITWEQFRTTNDDREISGSSIRTWLFTYCLVGFFVFGMLWQLFAAFLRRK